MVSRCDAIKWASGGSVVLSGSWLLSFCCGHSFLSHSAGVSKSLFRPGRVGTEVLSGSKSTGKRTKRAVVVTAVLGEGVPGFLAGFTAHEDAVLLLLLGPRLSAGVPTAAGLDLVVG